MDKKIGLAKIVKYNLIIIRSNQTIYSWIDYEKFWPTEDAEIIPRFDGAEKFGYNKALVELEEYVIKDGKVNQRELWPNNRNTEMREAGESQLTRQEPPTISA